LGIENMLACDPGICPFSEAIWPAWGRCHVDLAKIGSDPLRDGEEPPIALQLAPSTAHLRFRVFTRPGPNTDVRQYSAQTVFCPHGDYCLL